MEVELAVGSEVVALASAMTSVVEESAQRIYASQCRTKTRPLDCETWLEFYVRSLCLITPRSPEWTKIPTAYGGSALEA